MSPTTIYTLGYSKWKIEALAPVVARLDAVLFDVRYSPRSRNPDWSRKRLIEKFGDNYTHVREFGNLNYKSDSIRIADFRGGDEKFKAAMATGKPVILLCACGNVDVCHRKVIAEQLAQWHSLEVVHLDPADARPDEPKLFA